MPVVARLATVRPVPTPLVSTLTATLKNHLLSPSPRMPSPRLLSPSTEARTSRYLDSTSALVPTLPATTTPFEMVPPNLLLPPPPLLLGILPAIAAQVVGLRRHLRPTTGPIGATWQRGCVLQSMQSRMPSSLPSCRPDSMPPADQQVPRPVHRPGLPLPKQVQALHLPSLLPDSAVAAVPAVVLLRPLSVLQDPLGPELPLSPLEPVHR